MRKNFKPGDVTGTRLIAYYAVLILIAFVSLFPFYVMFVSSTLTTSQILNIPPRLIFGNHLLENFKNLSEKINIVRIIFNSLFIAITYTLLTLLLDSMAGYALAKYEFKGKSIIFGIIISTLMVPSQVTLVPMFIMMNKIGWQNTYWAIIFPALANAFGIFLMRQNMTSFPTALIEAARIDGCSEFGIFFQIVMPNMKPALGALGIYNFMSQWGNFMWPLIILATKDMYTLPVALASLEGLMYKDYGMMMLGSTISTIPIIIIFLIFQRQFVSGLIGGSIKE